MSSMSTTVIIDDEGRVVAVAGASGGTKIITAVAQTLFSSPYLPSWTTCALFLRPFHRSTAWRRVQHFALF